MEKSFSSLAELRAEIDFLKVKEFKDTEALKAGFKSPSALFGIFKSDSGKKSFTQDLLQQDIFTNISRVLIPLVLNGLVFKNSGFITKTLITFLSQKAAKQVSSDKLTGLLDKFSGMFKGNGKPLKVAAIRDYGIPPDSETY